MILPSRLVRFATVLVMLLLPKQGWAAGDGLAAAAQQAAVRVSPASLFGLGKHQFGLAAGYGFGVEILDDKGDADDVELIYVAPRWGIGISNPLGGEAWYRGNLELVGEGALLFNFEPEDGFAGGITAMFRYNFLPDGNFIPFVQLGAGIVSLDFDLDDQSDGLNFTPQGGLGFHYFVSERTALTGEWRFHHVSNADIDDPNEGINTSLFLVGFSIFLK